MFRCKNQLEIGDNPINKIVEKVWPDQCQMTFTLTQNGVAGCSPLLKPHKGNRQLLKKPCPPKQTCLRFY